MPAPVVAIPLALKALSGLGGAIAGYQKGGAKGALLGGGLGFVAPGAIRMAGTALGSALPAGALATGGGKIGGLGLQTALGASKLPAGYGLQTAGKALGSGLGNLGNLVSTPAGLGGALGLGAAYTGLSGGLGGNIGGAVAGPVGGGIGNALGAGYALGGYNMPGAGGNKYYDPSFGYTGAGSALPPGMGQFGGIDPYGNPIDVLNPLGQDAGRRTRMVKDAETQQKVMDMLMPTLRKYSEQAKKDDFERGMAAAGIKQNILTNAALTQEMQKAGLGMGTTAAQQAGSALTQKYTY